MIDSSYRTAALTFIKVLPFQLSKFLCTMHEAKLSEARFRRILSRTNRYQGFSHFNHENSHAPGLQLNYWACTSSLQSTYIVDVTEFSVHSHVTKLICQSKK